MKRTPSDRIAALLARPAGAELAAELAALGVPAAEQPVLVQQLYALAERVPASSARAATELALAVGIALALSVGRGNQV